MRFKALPISIAAIFVGLGLVACGSDGAAGPAGPAGPAGAPGTPGDSTNGGEATTPSTNVITPNASFLGRELDVQIGFTGGELAAQPKVDFGAGIKVTDVKLVSPTLLTAHLAIASDADVGVRDVKVDSAVAKGAFKVGASLGLTEVVKAEQGGFGAYLIDNLDTSYVFDTGENAFALDGGELLLPFSAAATGAYTGQGIFVVPPLAKAESTQLAAYNLDGTGSPLISFFGPKSSATVVARAATAVTFGSASAKETLAAPYGSKLYKFSTTADTPTLYLLNMHVTADAALTGVLWASGGTAKDYIGKAQPMEEGFFGRQPATPPYDFSFAWPASGASQSYFFSVLDTSGIGGTSFDFAPVALAATAVVEAADAHDTSATAQTFAAAAPGAANIITGEITDDKADWYKFTVAQDETVEVTMNSGVSNLEVSIRKGTDTEDEPGYSTGGAGKFAVGATGALAAGEYYLKIGKALGETTNLKGKYTVGFRRFAAAP